MEVIINSKHALQECSYDQLGNEGLKHLMFKIINDTYEVALVDRDGFECIKGYGRSIIDAINDLHSNLL